MKNYLAILLITTASLISLLSFSVHANDFTLGVGTSWTDSPYKGYGAEYELLPHIEFESDDFFIDDFSVGAYIYNQENQQLSLGLKYLSQGFNPNDSDAEQLKQLDKRHSTFLAEVIYTFTSQAGDFSTSIAGDILNKSNSILINGNYSYDIIGDIWGIELEIGMNWANSQHNNYYYGISHKESRRSGLRYYNAKSSFTPYISLIGSLGISEHMITYLGIRVDQLTGDAKNSPMIANNTIPYIFAGINYNF